MVETLFEDNHLLAINKPAGIATMGERPGTTTMVTEAKRYLKQRYHKPGNVYLGVVSRLDKPVSGVLLLAKTSKAAKRLARQFADQSTLKKYWAIVQTDDRLPARGRLETWVRKNELRRRMEVCTATARGRQWAVLEYRVLHQGRQRAWLEVELLTGRKHQIRLQLADLGCPILGDTKYGSQRTFCRGIALHAKSLEIEHPVRRLPLQIEAELPDRWPKRPVGLGGR